MEKETNVTQSTETTVLNSAEEATASMREVAEPIGALAEAGVSATDNGTNAADNIDNSASAPADAENMPVSPQESKSLKKAEFEKLIRDVLLSRMNLTDSVVDMDEFAKKVLASENQAYV